MGNDHVKCSNKLNIISNQINVVNRVCELQTAMLSKQVSSGVSPLIEPGVYSTNKCIFDTYNHSSYEIWAQLE